MRQLLVFAAAVVYCSVGTAQSIQQELREKLASISKACEPQAVILADARFSKWKKARPEQADKLSPETYETVRKVMHTQCVSIQHVALLQMIKSVIPSEEASRQNVDGEIARLMAVIERTL